MRQVAETHRRISIHALRVEGDFSASAMEMLCDTISIHALRVEGDMNLVANRNVAVEHFYPRPPGGGRQNFRSCPTCRILFLSTPSGWRATGNIDYVWGIVQ